MNATPNVGIETLSASENGRRVARQAFLPGRKGLPGIVEAAAQVAEAVPPQSVEYFGDAKSGHRSARRAFSTSGNFPQNGGAPTFEAGKMAAGALGEQLRRAARGCRPALALVFISVRRRARGSALAAAVSQASAEARIVLELKNDLAPPGESLPKLFNPALSFIRTAAGFPYTYE